MNLKELLPEELRQSLILPIISLIIILLAFYLVVNSGFFQEELANSNSSSLLDPREGSNVLNQTKNITGNKSIGKTINATIGSQLLDRADFQSYLKSNPQPNIMINRLNRSELEPLAEDSPVVYANLSFQGNYIYEFRFSGIKSGFFSLIGPEGEVLRTFSIRNINLGK